MAKANCLIWEADELAHVKGQLLNAKDRIEELEEALTATEADRDMWRGRVTQLEAEIEHLRVQLAGCGVAALANTHGSRLQSASKGDYGWSASYQDVLDAVEREIDGREYITALESENACLKIQVIDRGESYERLSEELKATVEEMNRIHQLKTDLHVSTDKCIADLEAELTKIKEEFGFFGAMDRCEKRVAQEICEYLSPIINIDSYTMEHIKQKYGLKEGGE